MSRSKRGFHTEEIIPFSFPSSIAATDKLSKTESRAKGDAQKEK